MVLCCPDPEVLKRCDSFYGKNRDIVTCLWPFACFFWKHFDRLPQGHRFDPLIYRSGMFAMRVFRDLQFLLCFPSLRRSLNGIGLKHKHTLACTNSSSRSNMFEWVDDSLCSQTDQAAPIEAIPATVRMKDLYLRRLSASEDGRQDTDPPIEYSTDATTYLQQTCDDLYVQLSAPSCFAISRTLAPRISNPRLTERKSLL